METSQLKKSGHFFLDIPKNNDNKDIMFIYQINILNNSITENKNEMCQVYLSYQENINDEKENKMDIFVLDNIPQKIMFNENFTHISYGYFHEKWENDIIIQFSSKYKAKYIAKIYYSNIKREKEENIMGEGIIYLNDEEWENICNNKECYIKIDITLVRSDYNENPEPILEISIKSLKEKNVNYIPKYEIIKDYIHYQKSQYYYTELGKNEIGYVNLNFLKGSGEVVGKIVEEDTIENNPDWKRKYVLPTKDNSNLQMDVSTKKLYFSTENYRCNKKCYLILNIYSNINNDKIRMRRIFPYNIFIQSHSNNIKNNELPIISAPIEEYIYGFLEKGKEKDVYAFYQYQFNLTKENIVIDIHSTIEEILVNIGNKRPIINESDFNFTLKDTIDEYEDEDNNYVFVISKDKLNIQNINLEELTLTISLHSSKFNDTIPKLPYLFSVHLFNGSYGEIFRINSDYQTLRRTGLAKSNPYLNLFYLIEYDYLSDFASLMFYARDSYEHNTLIYANYIDYEEYLFNNFSLGEFEYSNSLNEPYLFLKNGFIKHDKPQSILVLIYGNYGINRFYTSFYTYYNDIYIKLGSPSLKFVPKNESSTVFAPSLLENSVNFKYLAGQGEILYDIHNFIFDSHHTQISFGLSGFGKKIKEIYINDKTVDNSSICLVFYLEQKLEYSSTDIKDDSKGNNENSGDTILLIVGIIVGSAVVVIIIVIIIIVVNYNKKNKKIKEDINKISFEGERDSNLLINESKEIN